MGRKRKGLGTVRGAVTKKSKVPQKQPEIEYDILAIKISAATAVRPEHHEAVLPWIAKISIESTKICELASLLFLNHVRKYHEEENPDFFNGDGMHVIEECFYAVTQKYANNSDFMLPEFMDIYNGIDGQERMAWPNHSRFGNWMKYMPQQYSRNVQTNLKTHQKKRLTQFFRYCVYCENQDNPIDRFDETDVKNAVNWAIKRYDSTRGNVGRLNKGNYLLAVVREIGGPTDNDIAKFTRDNWFKSMPMWLTMQQYIDEFHDEQQRNGVRVPKIKNLSVVPICSHMRKPIRIDADVLYRMLCETKLIPLGENKRQVVVGFVCQNKEYFFNQIFNMDKIHRILKSNKEFHYQIVSDGVSVSILYKVPKRVLQEMQNDHIVKKRYFEGFYVYEIGIDPGMKTWLAVVRRHINTGKEVCNLVFIVFRFISMPFDCCI